MSNPPVNPNTVNDSEGVATTVVSPTGAPAIPPAAVPYLALGSAVLLTFGEELAHGGGWDAARVVRLVSTVLTVALGIASPGIRRKAQ